MAEKLYLVGLSMNCTKKKLADVESKFNDSFGIALIFCVLDDDLGIKMHILLCSTIINVNA
jgi:hypothetical protein